MTPKIIITIRKPSASLPFPNLSTSVRANALTTMLPNDMSTYAETLEPGQTQELVLLLEVNEDVAGAVQTIALRLKNASNEYTIQLL